MKKTVVVSLLAIFLIFNNKSSAQTTVQQNKYQGVVVETEKPNEIGQKVKVKITACLTKKPSRGLAY